MKKLSVILIIILCIVAGVFQPVQYTYATEAPIIEAQRGIVIDSKTGTILYEKDMHSQGEPASITKVMTCILALENLEMEQVVEIDHETSFTGGSRIYLIEGELIEVKHLLRAMMLESANDAAVALAKAVAGSVADFAVMMNEKAKELGALNTNFVNPHGLHEEGHLTTCYDMALIAQYAMKNETFRELVTTYRYEIPATNKQPERYMYNTNRLLYDNETKAYVNGVLRGCKYEGCTGIKTGYTPQAGGCLISGAEKDGTEFISVVMQSSDLGRFADSIALLDYAFANYHTTQAVVAGAAMGPVPVKHGAVKQVETKTAGNAYVVLPMEASTSIVTTKTVWAEELKAPIAVGQVVGTVEVYEGAELSTTVDIVAAEAVEEGTFLSYIGIEDKTAYKIFWIAGITFAIILIAFIWLMVSTARRKKRRRLQRERRAMEIAMERERKRRELEMRDWRF